jgi:hypothetical protein
MTGVQSCGRCIWRAAAAAAAHSTPADAPARCLVLPCRLPLQLLTLRIFDAAAPAPTAAAADMAQSYCVGQGPEDAGFAQGLGLQLRDPRTFFGE